MVKALAEPTGAAIRLHRGTDAASADDMASNGVDAQKAQDMGADGAFWATVNEASAEIFAQVNVFLS